MVGSRADTRLRNGNSKNAFAAIKSKGSVVNWPVPQVRSGAVCSIFRIVFLVVPRMVLLYGCYVYSSQSEQCVVRSVCRPLYPDRLKLNKGRRDCIGPARLKKSC